MKSFFEKLLVEVAKSNIKSTINGQIKKAAKEIFKKSDQSIKQEMIDKIGFETTHFKLDNKQNIIFKSSSVFFYEWLTKNPKILNRIKKDEENGSLFFDNSPLNAQHKVYLIEKYIEDTDVKSTAISSHLDGALKLLPPSDFSSEIFKNKYSGWNENNASVIDAFLDNAFGNSIVSDKEFSKLLFRKWIIGTAKRASNPGSSFDGCLTFKGPAGVGKTQFFRNILPDRTGEIYCNIKNPQKFIENIVGKTVVCFDELSVLEHQNTRETFKQLLSSQAVDVRLPWRKDPQRFLLRSGFGATTNKDKFIFDPFLSRRMWVIELNNSQRLNFDFLFANRDNLWKEALYLANKGESCYLSQEEQFKLEENNKKYLV